MPLSTIRTCLLAVVALLVALPAQAQQVLDTPTWTLPAGSVDWFSATDNTARGGALNPATGHFLVVSRPGDPPAPQVNILGAEDGEVLGQLNVTGIPATGAGFFPLNLIGATSDGQIFASNMVLTANEANPLRIYRWANEGAAPELVWSGIPSAHRYGDSFGVFGSGNQVYVFVSGPGHTSIAEFMWDGEEMSAPRLIPVATGAARGAIARGRTAATLWINGGGTTLREINRETGEIVREIPGTVVPAAYMVATHFAIDGRQFVAAGIKNPEMEAEIVDVTDPGAPVVVARTARFGTNANANATGAIAYDRARNQLILLGTNNGVAAYDLDFLLPDVLADAEWKIQAGSVDWFGINNTERGAAYNPATDNVVVVSRAAGPSLRILHAGTGEERGTMNVTGISGGTFALSEIAITEDGQIFAANLTTDAAASPARIYRWRNERAMPELVFSGALPAPSANWTAGRYGDGIGVYGSGDDVDVYLGGSNNDTIVRFNWDGEALTQAAVLVPEAGVQRGRFGLAPVSRDELWINGAGAVLALVDANTGDIIREVLDSPRSTAGGYLAYFTLDGRQHLATGPQFGIEEGFAVYDVTTPGSEYVVALTEVLGPNPNLNAAGSPAWDFRRNNLIVLSTNNAVASYSLMEADMDAAPSQPLVRTPADGATLTVEGGAGQEVVVSWTAARDLAGSAFTYTWELAASEDAEEPLAAIDAEGETSLTLTIGDIDALLEEAGVAVGQSVQLVHRAVAMRNGTTVTGDWARVTMTRGVVGLMTIADARAEPLGTEVTVEGVVTRARGTFTYFQDDTAGLTVRQTSGSAWHTAVGEGDIAPGTRVRVTGVTSQFRGLIQINAADLRSFEILGEDEVPEAQEVTLAELRDNGEAYEAQLVRVRDLNTRATGTFAAASSYNVGDETVTLPETGSSAVVLRIPNAADTEWAGRTIPESPFTFEGVVGQFTPNSDGTPADEGYQLLAIGADDLRSTVSSDPGVVPVAFGVEGNYPNPFAGRTALRFDLPADAEVRVEVYDVMGRRVLAVPAVAVSAGAGQSLALDADGLAAGTYLWRLTADTAGESFTQTGRMTIVR
jgi:DNA/RNA endonuclease YhcR with UshA esterase domain